MAAKGDLLGIIENLRLTVLMPAWRRADHGLLWLIPENPRARLFPAAEIAKEIKRELECVPVRKSVQRRAARRIPSCKKLEYWVKNGWALPLRYYVSSLHILPVDWTDPSGAKRRTTLQGFVKQHPPPKRIKPNGRSIRLTRTSTSGSKSVPQALLERRTVREFSDSNISATIFGRILWRGLEYVRRTRRAARERNGLGLLRTYGLAFDVYVVVYSVTGIPAGVYYLDIDKHNLILVKHGLFRRAMATVLAKQSPPMSANFTIVLVADVAIHQWRYRHERAFRNLMIDAGRIAQGLIITSETCGISCFTTPALHESRMGAILRLRNERLVPLYTVTGGIRKEKV